MMRYFHHILLLILAGSLSACFEMVEEVTVNEDLSGRYALTANMSQSKGQLDKLMLKDSIQGRKIPGKADISSELDRVVQQLEQSEAFSNVTVRKDFDNYIFSVKFDFTHINELDKGLKEVMGSLQADEKLIKGIHFFGNEEGVKKVIDPGLIADANSQLGTWERNELKEAQLISIYRLGQPVKSYSNEAYKLSTSKKSLFLKVRLLDVLSGAGSLENHIHF